MNFWTGNLYVAHDEYTASGFRRTYCYLVLLFKHKIAGADCFYNYRGHVGFVFNPSGTKKTRC